MSNIFSILIVTYAALLVASVVSSNNHEQKRDAFVERCEAKGGITLSGYRTTGGWIGCYTNLVEVENEQ